MWTNISVKALSVTTAGRFTWHRDLRKSEQLADCGLCWWMCVWRTGRYEGKCRCLWSSAEEFGANPFLDIRLLSRPFPTVWRKTEEFLFSLNSHLYTFVWKVGFKRCLLDWRAPKIQQVQECQNSIAFLKKKEMFGLHKICHFESGNKVDVCVPSDALTEDSR